MEEAGQSTDVQETEDSAPSTSISQTTVVLQQNVPSPQETAEISIDDSLEEQFDMGIIIYSAYARAPTLNVNIYLERIFTIFVNKTVNICQFFVKTVKNANAKIREQLKMTKCTMCDPNLRTCYVLILLSALSISVAKKKDINFCSLLYSHSSCLSILPLLFEFYTISLASFFF